MTARLIKLLIGSFLFFCLGIALFPALFPTQVDRVTKVKEQPVVVKRDTVVDDWSNENEVEDSDDAWVEDEPEVDDTPDRRVARMDDETFDEEDVYDQKWSEGFITLYGLPTAVFAKMKAKNNL
jgi:hypothetical protein